MKKKLCTLLLILFVSLAVKAQDPVSQPFLFSVNTLTPGSPHWSINTSGNYAEHTTGSFGYDGMDQQVAVKGYLGNRLTLYANADLGFARAGGTTSAQQAEVIRDIIGGKNQYGLRFGVGLGGNRDFSGVGAVFSRVTASFDAFSWRLAGNLRFEKAFSEDRDGIDLITSLGFQYRISGPVFAGLELVGEDLEGFWENETEGGAKLMIGPSINITPSNSRFSFSVCGGPVFYATHSTDLSSAIRDVGTLASQNGYTIRAMLAFNLHR